MPNRYRSTKEVRRGPRTRFYRVAVADTKSGNEDTIITGSVATNDSDADNGAVLAYNLNAPVAGLTLNADGSYSFDAANATYQHLSQGATERGGQLHGHRRVWRHGAIHPDHYPHRQPTTRRWRPRRLRL
jgi:hypothetical protein